MKTTDNKPTSAPMLRVDQLECGYGSTPVLHGVTLEIGKGEIVGVIGPNGSGKTTLLRSMTGILSPTQGTVTLDGQDIHSMQPKQLAGEIAVVSQGTEATMMKVEDFVMLGRLPYYARFQFMETKHDRDMAQESMVMTDSIGIKDKFMSEISGGERQLVYIARALTQQTSLLLLDEPTAHLDIAHQVKILDLIRKLNRTTGVTVVMVLHDLNQAGEYCNRLVLMDDGRVHAVGTPDDVLQYQTIEAVYRTVVVVEKNPLSSKPYVLLVSEDDRDEDTKRGEPNE
jgi:iron complex transport system ATP-binding protein